MSVPLPVPRARTDRSRTSVRRDRGGPTLRGRVVVRQPIRRQQSEHAPASLGLAPPEFQTEEIALTCSGATKAASQLAPLQDPSLINHAGAHPAGVAVPRVEIEVGLEVFRP